MFKNKIKKELKLLIKLNVNQINKIGSVKDREQKASRIFYK